jgi:cobyrinic acid a,c-diamide synthase
VNVAGVIFNRDGSDVHERLLREAVAPFPALGALRRDERVVVPERHLGLVPVAEREGAARRALDALAAAMERDADLDAVVSLVRSAPEVAGPAWSPAGEQVPARIAIARGPAFSFHYQENLELVEGAGAELVPFDPLTDESLPDAGALILAGGFPEVFGAELEANAPLRAAIRDFAATRPVLAECGGLLYLCESIDGHAMCGALPARASMAGRLSLGYREAVAATATPWLEAGLAVRGHEFHYSRVETAGPPAWTFAGRGPEGVVRGGIQASYLHVHWAAFPELARAFARAAATPARV